MTFTVRLRGDSTAPIVAEYNCPEHGVFEATVQRPAPDEMRCPVEEQEFSDLPDGLRACMLRSPWCISAPSIENDALKVRAVSLGGDMKERPPGMLDTRPLADGMKLTEWKKLQREQQKKRRHQVLIDKGVIKKKVIVG